MHGGKRRGLLAVVLVLAAVVAVPATVVGTATGDEVGQQSAEATASGDRDAPSNASRAVASTPAQSDVIVVEQEYRLTPGEKGQVDVRWKFTVPENVIQISTQLPDDATDPRRNGFRKTTDGYVWEESEQSTRTPTLTYTAAVNQTDEVSGPIGTEGEYLFADTGEWALIQRQPGPGLSFRYRGDQPTIERTNTTAGAGVAGESMIFLGSHETYERSAYDQQFRLIVPEAATLTPSRDDVFETVTDASASLRVGDRDQQVLMFVAPASVPWAVRGLQVGDRDFYAVADESVNAAGNVWIHEYVHTRQDFERGDAIRWFVEASAQYYAGLLTLEQGRIDFDAFRDALSRGTERRFEDVVLADPATWEGTGGNYYTGVLVAGELDRQIRIATDRQGTLQGVLGRMNGQPSPVSQADFLGSVERVGGTTPADLARRYTERTDRPDVWSQREHGDAFDPLPASFTYALPPAGSDDRRVRGLYRNRTLASEPLVTGETLALGVNVTNAGGSEGTYDLTVSQNGSVIATRSGSVRAEASTTEVVETTFEEPGTYRLSAGESEATVEVREPATATVSRLDANRTRVRGSGTVSVTATVENGANRPADGTVAIRQNGSVLIEQTVRLDAGASTAVSTTVALNETGTYQFTAGDRSVSVTVAVETEKSAESTAESGAADGGNGASGPGFGVLAAVLAVAALLVGHRIQ